MEDKNSSSEDKSQLWKNLKHDMLDAIRLVLLVAFGITAWGYYHYIQKGIDALGLAIISGACIISVAITFLRR